MGDYKCKSAHTHKYDMYIYIHVRSCPKKKYNEIKIINKNMLYLHQLVEYRKQNTSYNLSRNEPFKIRKIM
jgi:hypothetical protein